MVKNSKAVKWISLVISIVLGALIGWKTYDVPVSQTILKFRIIAAVAAVFLVIVGIIGAKLVQKYDVNDELVIDDDMEEYFDYTLSKFKSNIIIGIIIAVLLEVITFVGVYHIDIMMVACSIYYFVVMFIYVCPLVDEIITIIRMSIEWNRIKKGY